MFAFNNNQQNDKEHEDCNILYKCNISKRKLTPATLFWTLQLQWRRQIVGYIKPATHDIKL